MIAKVEWTQRNAQQNIEQLQNPTVSLKETNLARILEKLVSA